MFLAVFQRFVKVEPYPFYARPFNYTKAYCLALAESFRWFPIATTKFEGCYIGCVPPTKLYSEEATPWKKPQSTIFSNFTNMAAVWIFKKEVAIRIGEMIVNALGFETREVYVDNATNNTKTAWNILLFNFIMFIRILCFVFVTFGSWILWSRMYKIKNEESRTQDQADQGVYCLRPFEHWEHGFASLIYICFLLVFMLSCVS
jgi:hypothetical protein